MRFPTLYHDRWREVLRVFGVAREKAQQGARANDHGCHDPCSEQHGSRQPRSWLIFDVGQMRALAFIALMVSFAIPADACRCAPKPPIPEAARKADAVFVGRVMKLAVAYRKESPQGEREVIECEFSIGAALKGIEVGREKITIITSPHGAACGYPFRIGDEYLVYARKEAKELETDVCMRTRPLVIIDEKQDFSNLSKIKGDDAMQTEVPFIREALKKK
jgi:hypothetical protein